MVESPQVIGDGGDEDVAATKSSAPALFSDAM